jgi:hypothetical protein
MSGSALSGGRGGRFALILNVSLASFGKQVVRLLGDRARWKSWRQSSALNSGAFHVTSNHDYGEFSEAFRTPHVTQVQPSWQKNCKKILVMSL